MVRTSSFLISGINIVIHPHSPEKYIELFNDIYKKREVKHVRGYQYIMIGELWPLNNDPLKGLKGSLYRFLQIDKDAVWFDVLKNNKASKEDLSRIELPENLRPNTEIYDFIFYPIGHTLYISLKSTTKIRYRYPTISISQVNNGLNMLFSSFDIIEKYGKVETTIIPDKQQLANIFSIPVLKKLTIDIIKPNTDDLSSAQHKVMKRFNNMNVRRTIQTYDAEKNYSIIPDEDLKCLASVAATNGEVIGQGSDLKNTKIKISTKERPWMQTVTYNPLKQSSTNAFENATSDLTKHNDIKQ